MIQYNYPTIIYSGEGSAHSLGEFLQGSNHQKAMIVSDKQLVKLGLIQVLLEDLNFTNKDYVLFDGVHPNPIEDDVVKGVECYRKNACDYLIALGGGVPLMWLRSLRLCSLIHGLWNNMMMHWVVLISSRKSCRSSMPFHLLRELVQK